MSSSSSTAAAAQPPPPPYSVAVAPPGPAAAAIPASTSGNDARRAPSSNRSRSSTGGARSATADRRSPAVPTGTLDPVYGASSYHSPPPQSLQQPPPQIIYVDVAALNGRGGNPFNAPRLRQQYLQERARRKYNRGRGCRYCCLWLLALIISFFVWLSLPTDGDSPHWFAPVERRLVHYHPLFTKSLTLLPHSEVSAYLFAEQPALDKIAAYATLSDFGAWTPVQANQSDAAVRALLMKHHHRTTAEDDGKDAGFMYRLYGLEAGGNITLEYLLPSGADKNVPTRSKISLLFVRVPSTLSDGVQVQSIDDIYLSGGYYGSIRLTAEKAGPHVVLFVTNNLSGLNPDVNPGKLITSVRTRTYSLRSPIKVCPALSSKPCAVYADAPPALFDGTRSFKHVVYVNADGVEPDFPGVLQGTVNMEGRAVVYAPIRTLLTLLVIGSFLSIFTTCCCGWSVMDGWRSLKLWCCGERVSEEDDERQALLQS
ncbi:hypothetical protein DFJ73DRAFT_831354 [Zopfochytrium polystomum]|nr:hypothetical protein DFJ73DRAFT_831354 [Zopfochytrium polystomum]